MCCWWAAVNMCDVSSTRSHRRSRWVTASSAAQHVTTQWVGGQRGACFLSTCLFFSWLSGSTVFTVVAWFKSGLSVHIKNVTKHRSIIKLSKDGPRGSVWLLTWNWTRADTHTHSTWLSWKVLTNNMRLHRATLPDPNGFALYEVFHLGMCFVLSLRDNTVDLR